MLKIHLSTRFSKYPSPPTRNPSQRVVSLRTDSLKIHEQCSWGLFTKCETDVCKQIQIQILQPQWKCESMKASKEHSSQTHEMLILRSKFEVLSSQRRIPGFLRNALSRFYLFEKFSTLIRSSHNSLICCSKKSENTKILNHEELAAKIRKYTKANRGK